MSMWATKRVLVTGAGGFIGSHLVEALIRQGAAVTGFVRYNSRGDIGSLSLADATVRADVRIVMGDLKDPAAVRAAVQGIDTIFHLGALIGIPYSYVHPLDYVQTNIAGTANILEAVRDTHGARLVLYSTSEVYGTAERVPIDEGHRLHPQSPYAASKVAADQLALSYHRSFGVPVTIVRPFNTYGPRQPARAIIPSIIAQALQCRTVRLGSLSPTRDLLYVDDNVRGALLAAESDALTGEVVNLASNAEISVGDLAARIFLRLGMTCDVIVEEARVRPARSEVMQLRGDWQRAERVLGWRPEVGLDEGLDRTIDWIRRNPALTRADYNQI